MLFNNKNRSAINKAGRKGLAVITVIFILASIAHSLDFSGIGAKHIIITVVFAGLWLAASIISAKLRWMRFRMIALIYWGVALVSSAGRLLMVKLNFKPAGRVLGSVQYVLAELPLGAIIQAVDKRIMPEKAAFTTELLFFIVIMVVFYVILWRNEKLLLD